MRRIPAHAAPPNLDPPTQCLRLPHLPPGGGDGVDRHGNLLEHGAGLGGGHQLDSCHLHQRRRRRENAGLRQGNSATHYRSWGVKAAQGAPCWRLHSRIPAPIPWSARLQGGEQGRGGGSMLAATGHWRPRSSEAGKWGRRCSALALATTAGHLPTSCAPPSEPRVAPSLSAPCCYCVHRTGRGQPLTAASQLHMSAAGGDGTACLALPGRCALTSAACKQAKPHQAGKSARAGHWCRAGERASRVGAATTSWSCLDY